MGSLFASFNIARSGLNVQQKAIEVASNNISNVNTAGYSRQTAIIKSTASKNLTGINQIGNGAQIDSVIRVRNSYLDYQINKGNSSYGSYNSKNEVLSEIETVFNEVSDTGISSKLNDFFNAWQELAKNPNNSLCKKMVIEQTSSLCDSLNLSSNKLDSIKENVNNKINGELIETNSLISQIDSINKDIVSITANGGIPNELMDQRNVLLDKLSLKVGINVNKTSNNGISINFENDKNTGIPNLINQENDLGNVKLAYISNIQKDMTDQSSNSYIISYQTDDSKIYSVKVSNISDKQLSQLDNNRTLFTDSSNNILLKDGKNSNNSKGIDASNLIEYSFTSGSINGYIESKDNIENYSNQLDKIAKAVAFSVNAVHSGITDPLNTNSVIEKDYLPFFVNSDVSKYKSNGELNNLDETLIAENSINARNISINKELSTSYEKIKVKENDNLFVNSQDNNIDESGNGSRALEIANLKDKIFNVESINESIFTRADFFNSTKGGATLNNGLSVSNSSVGMKLNSFYTDLISNIGFKVEESNIVLKNQEDYLSSLETDRSSESGVSLDEELANLVQFQHAYNANAKVLSTIDELLDVIINGLG